MSGKKRYDFFISYRRNCLADELAERLALMARAMQLNVYYDHEEIRDGHFDEKLKKGIAESRYFLLVISEGSLSRCANPGDWVAEEIKCALDNDIPIKVVTYEGQSPQWPESMPPWMETLRTCHIETLPSHHHNLNGAFFRLISDSMPDIMLRDQSEHGQLLKTLYAKARRFIENDGEIDSQERKRLEGFCTRNKIGKAELERVVERVESEYEAENLSATKKGNAKSGKKGSSEDADAFSIILGLAFYAGAGWLLWLLAKWCWNNIGFIGHWAWLIVKWPLYVVGGLIGLYLAWEQLKAMFKGAAWAWLLLVGEIVAYFVLF